MPELPEVEMYARYFTRHALGLTIAAVRVLDARIVTTRKLSALHGRSFTRVVRHGKHLFASAPLIRPSATFSPQAGRRGSLELPRPAERGEGAAKRRVRGAGDIWLHLHFGMTGDLVSYRDDPPRFARVIFDFDNGAHLAYEDMRLFGMVGLTSSPGDYIQEHGLGPDPLQIRLPDFRRLLAGRRGRIKALLLSQKVLAGVGNLYADEALYRASIRPRRGVDSLSVGEVAALFRALQGVLRQTIAFKARGGDYPGRYLIQHREEGDRCPRCGGTIRRTIVAGRTTYFCPKHQR